MPAAAVVFCLDPTGYQPRAEPIAAIQLGDDMALKRVVELVDDLGGGDSAAETIEFGFDGVHYQIDLSQEHADEMRRAMQRWIAGARRTGGRATHRSSAPSVSIDPLQAAAIRQWGANNGFTVNPRGRLSAELRAAFAAAHLR